MCGIAGIIEFGGRLSDERSGRVKRMTRMIAHRGPDAEGFCDKDGASLGHRRLSIIDLESGSQPMVMDDGRLSLIFNGEIYNFKDIRSELTAAGHVFRTESDTEVVLHAYAEWGEECLGRFNGMFALAIWDARENILFLARDRVGKKPLYYARLQNTVVFASELKSILASGLVEAELDNKALMDYLSFGYVPCPRTIYSSVQKMPAASYRIEKLDGSRAERYWNPSFAEVRQRSDAELTEELAELLDDAVCSRMVSDVPLGAFLSGGIDSSLVVAAMARNSSSKVKTHTIGTGHSEHDEASLARQTATFLGTEHHEFIVSPEDESPLEEIAWHLDEPFADPSVLPTWHVCKMTRKSVTVALSGDGGDEAFGGYTFRYLPHRLESQVRSLLPAALRAAVFGPLGRIWPRSASLPKALRLSSIFENLAVGDAEAFYRDLLVVSESGLSNLLRPEFVESLAGYNGFENVSRHYIDNDAKDALSRAQYADINFYMTDDVLVKVDRMSMAHGLEVRAPLLDYRIIEFAASLESKQKMSLSKGKLPLRALAAEQLPQTLLSQPKRGFTIPINEWLKGGMKDFFADRLFNSSGLISEAVSTNAVRTIWDEHQKGQRDNSAFLWSLVMLGMWESQFQHGHLKPN
jgi:asparagine synthase (glutamine-hydrolysing)